MENFKMPSSYYDPPEEMACLDCQDGGCIDGKLEGRDGDGRDIADECTCKCHGTIEDAKLMAAEERFDAEREDGRP